MIEIYYTFGPSSEKLTREMFQAGADGARLTFSYGTPEIQLARAQLVHTEAKKEGIVPRIIADLEGGGFRIGEFVGGDGKSTIPVATGEQFLCVYAASCDVHVQKVIPIPDKRLIEKFAVGDTLIIGDGSAELIVEEITPEIRVRNLFETTIEGRRGVWLQSTGSAYEPSCLTEKDVSDLYHIAEHKEYTDVALSFVSSADDVVRARDILKHGSEPKRLIAKIETMSGVRNIDEICEVADEIMIARGDLELAVSWKNLPRTVDHLVERI